jgi:hypothetical protein
VLDKCLSNFAGKPVEPTEPIDELQEIYGLPQKYSLPDMARKINARKSVIILVGAGVSAESGVPTYKGNVSTYPIGGREMTHEEAACVSVFHEYPLDFWKR